MQMLPVCWSTTPATARPLTPRGHGPGHAGTPCQARVAAGRRVAEPPPVTAPRLRARTSCVGAGGSGEMMDPVPVAEAEEADEAVVAEELESLEEAAIAGEDEGRKPTDYDRRAHIFEESSRVFSELKHRRDHGDVRAGGVQQGGGDGTAAETTATQQQLG